MFDNRVVDEELRRHGMWLVDFRASKHASAGSFSVPFATFRLHVSAEKPAYVHRQAIRRIGEITRDNLSSKALPGSIKVEVVLAHHQPAGAFLHLEAKSLEGTLWILPNCEVVADEELRKMMEGDVSAIKGHSIKTMVVDDPVDPLKHPSLETASGTRLDALAYPLGVSRADGETDAQLRKRAKIAAVWKMKNPTTAAGLPPWGKTETPETFASKFQRFAAGDKEE